MSPANDSDRYHFTDPGSAEPLAPLEQTPKHALRSITVWLQIVSLLSVLIPAVQVWLQANPVEFVAALSAVNVLVRFATSGRITVFPVGGENRIGGGGVGLVAAFLTALCLLSLPSCGVTGSVVYRDAQTGAKGGVEFGERSVQPFLRWPWSSGDQSGVVDVRRAIIIHPAK